LGVSVGQCVSYARQVSLVMKFKVDGNTVVSRRHLSRKQQAQSLAQRPPFKVDGNSALSRMASSALALGLPMQSTNAMQSRSRRSLASQMMGNRTPRLLHRRPSSPRKWVLQLAPQLRLRQPPHHHRQHAVQAGPRRCRSTRKNAPSNRILRNFVLLQEKKVRSQS